MNTEILTQTHTLSHNNRHMTGQCGCFYCKSVFNASEITKWIDAGQTALCPKCSIDSVIPGGDDRTTPEFLAAMYAYWVTPESV